MDQAIKKEVIRYRFSRRSNTKQVLIVAAVILLVSLITYAVVFKFHLEKVSWSDAFVAMLSLGVAIVAYQQWRENRYEISIDKYYDFLAEANRRLECLEEISKKQMHAYVELDKLEYVIVKYELGFIPDKFAKRAIDNFKCHCMQTEQFQSCVQKALAESAYLEKTKKVANMICKNCDKERSRIRNFKGHKINAGNRSNED
jgi:hypothetical protein